MDVVFCVPAIDLSVAIDAVKGSNIEIGAENMYFEESGAYTGEIAPNSFALLFSHFVDLRTTLPSPLARSFAYLPTRFGFAPPKGEGRVVRRSTK